MALQEKYVHKNFKTIHQPGWTMTTTNQAKKKDNQVENMVMKYITNEQQVWQLVSKSFSKPHSGYFKYNGVDHIICTANGHDVCHCKSDYVTSCPEAGD